MADHNELGKLGEELALKHLRSKDYKILELNWHFGREEIDIIAMDGETLVIIEVKTRATSWFGEPEFAVTRSKQKALVRAAEGYIIKNNLNVDTRFDIISIIITPHERKVDHIEDAFYPTL
ncbi:MAG: putative endonuclease related to Holliday junction resolvase [Bacteroidetes bacterium]|jgi:putative endonuclease|nr:MAG: putative endonuclease related to Holliday junction resolvase [Bacteroidota bacterium]